ncbi:MAG: deoxynucleoside kinase [Anaerolineales bacterium]|nr:deoxynucleoside kinase [Anaerolineales bacterium]
MGNLICVIGNSGVGKTTLVKAISQSYPFSTGLEQHTARPFQQQFKENPGYALANQVDYLLLRAEQEHHIRCGEKPGLVDGGMEMDFYIFTKLFLQKGYLNQDQFILCKRLYEELRKGLPYPDLFIFLSAPVELIQQRYNSRGKVLRIAQSADLHHIDALLNDWIPTITANKLFQVDTTAIESSYKTIIPTLLKKIQTL